MTEGICAPSPGDELTRSSRVIPLWPTPDRFTESIRLYGSKNVEAALEFVERITHPVTGLAILLPSDDDSVSDIIAAGFSALKREELNSEGFQEQLRDAIHTCLHTLKLPVVLNTDGTMSVYDPGDGTQLFEGSNWDFVRWMRDQEIGAATHIPGPEEAGFNKEDTS